MKRILTAHRPPPLALALLVLAALTTGIAGFEHARLWHRGYAEVEVVGPLFLLNALATAVVLLLLVFERVRLFVLGVLAVCIGSLVSILLSHSSHFFEFRESGYDGTAKLIVITELAGVAFALAALATGALRHQEREADTVRATGSVAS